MTSFVLWDRRGASRRPVPIDASRFRHLARNTRSCSILLCNARSRVRAFAATCLLLSLGSFEIAEREGRDILGV